jgi:hypothetical protein
VVTKRKRKVGRPKKKAGEPVDHRLTPKMRVAIVAMVEDGKTVEEAAEVAGLKPRAIRAAMKTPPGRELYKTELQSLLTCAKALAAHALIRELKGDNAAARVAAARTLLAEDERKAPAQGMPQMPGFIFLVNAPNGQALPIPNGHAGPLIEASAVGAEVVRDGD